VTPPTKIHSPLLCLVGCSKTKLGHPAPARELYCSPLFRLCRAWAERHADTWAILSARHGVVAPDEVLAPYQGTLAERRPFGGHPLSPAEYGRWLYAHVQAWRSRYVTPAQVPRLVVLAGNGYWQPLSEHGLVVEAPLEGLGIGERLRWLKRQLSPGNPTRKTPPGQLLLFPTDL
jgi:hypothetical protein